MPSDRGPAPARSAAPPSTGPEQLLRLLVDSVKDYAIFVLTPEGNVASWNPGAERIKGYTAGEIIGSHFSRFYLREEIEAGKCEMELVEAARVGRFEDEGWRLRKDGSRFWANVVITALRTADGELVGYAKVTRDLTPRKQAEDDARRLAEAHAARSAAEALQTISTAFAGALVREQIAAVVFEHVLPALGVDGGNLGIRDGDALEMQWSGGDRAEMPGDRRRFGLHASLPHAEAARTGVPIFLDTPAEIAAKYPELAAMFEGLHGVALLPLMVRGDCIGVLGLTRTTPRGFDVGERIMASTVANQCALALDRALVFERELEAKRRADFVAEASVVLSASLDDDAVVQRLAAMLVPTLGDWCAIDMVDGDSTRQAAVVHRDPERVKLARELRDRFPPEPQSRGGVHEVIRTGQPILYKEISEELLVARTRDPEHQAAIRAIGMRSAVIAPLVARGRTIGAMTLVWAESDRCYGDEDLALLSDLGRRAALAIENARLYQDVQTAVRVRDDFMSVAGHELRTPLAAMLLNMQSLERLVAKQQPEPTDPRIAERLRKAHDNGNRLERLITELLDVSRITANRLQLELESLDLAELVRGVAASLSDHASKVESELRLRVDEALVGQWDRFRIEQVVSNLFTNALKYGRGKPVDVCLRREGRDAVLEVRDYGIGIEARHHRRIFERFERAVSERHYGGLGLGLWISRQIVDASGGTIDVTSTPGEGSCFIVRLPIQPIMAQEGSDAG